MKAKQMCLAGAWERSSTGVEARKLECADGVVHVETVDSMQLLSLPSASNTDPCACAVHEA